VALDASPIAKTSRGATSREAQSRSASQPRPSFWNAVKIREKPGRFSYREPKLSVQVWQQVLDFRKDLTK
jgi:hypothetical protein